jgi:two-component system OmpR family response regulator
VADLELDLATRTVMRGGRAIQLSPRHFDLLACLMRNRGQAVRRETLLKAVRGQRRDPGARILETSIAQLRAKVDRGFGVELIHPVPGIGYCLLDEE